MCSLILSSLKYLLISEGKTITLQWGNPADTTFIKRTRLTPLVIRHKAPLLRCTENMSLL